MFAYNVQGLGVEVMVRVVPVTQNADAGIIIEVIELHTCESVRPGYLGPTITLGSVATKQ